MFGFKYKWLLKKRLFTCVVRDVSVFVMWHVARPNVPDDPSTNNSAINRPRHAEANRTKIDPDKGANSKHPDDIVLQWYYVLPSAYRLCSILCCAILCPEGGRGRGRYRYPAQTAASALQLTSRGCRVQGPEILTAEETTCSQKQSENTDVPQLLLCLSRACLGKTVGFWYKNGAPKRQR